MKLIIFILLFFSLSSHAQKKKAISATTLTTKQLTTITAKLQANFTDSIKYLTERLNLSFWQNERLNQRATALEKTLDSVVVVIPNINDFDFDSTTKVLSLKERWPDTIVIYKKSPRVPGQSNTMQGLVGSDVPNELKPLAMPYKFSTDTPKEQQDIADYKWQIDYFEKLLDDDKKVMDKLQKIIKAQQKEIDKLKKN